MWKKIVGIICLAVGGVLLTIYAANWIIDDPYGLYEATISIQESYINSKEDYISQCEDAIDEVYEYQKRYGSDYTTNALIESYEDLKDEAKSQITDARITIFKENQNIRTLRTTGIAILMTGIAVVVTGVIFLDNYRRNRTYKS